MGLFGRRKDGQAYPKRNKSSINKRGTTSARGFPITSIHKEQERHNIGIEKRNSRERNVIATNWSNDEEWREYNRATYDLITNNVSYGKAEQFLARKGYTKNVLENAIMDHYEEIYG